MRYHTTSFYEFTAAYVFLTKLWICISPDITNRSKAPVSARLYSLELSKNEEEAVCTIKLISMTKTVMKLFFKLAHLNKQQTE